MQNTLFTFLFSTWFVFFLACKPSTTDTFDELRRTASVFSHANFCTQNKEIQNTRFKECESAFLESKNEIERILTRQMDLTLTKVIIPRAVGEEIELLLRTKTDLGIRYLEIWKQSVILE